MSISKVILRPVTLFNASGDLITGDLRFQSNASNQPLLIICHSFMAFKDWGFFPYLGSRLASLGYATYLFNFSHNGAGDGSTKITDFDLFARNTFSKELEDLQAIVDYFTQDENVIDAVWDPHRPLLMGHSRGGGISILHAGGDERVKGLVSLSSIAFFDRWTSHQKRIWRQEGYYSLSRHSSASPLRLGTASLDDLENNAGILDIGLAASRVRCPWLILHGAVDLTVPVREAELLYERSNQEMTTLSVMPHAGHLFNAASRSEDGYAMLDAVIDTAHDWLHNYC